MRIVKESVLNSQLATTIEGECVLFLQQQFNDDVVLKCLVAANTAYCLLLLYA